MFDFNISLTLFSESTAWIFLNRFFLLQSLVFLSRRPSIVRTSNMAKLSCVRMDSNQFRNYWFFPLFVCLYIRSYFFAFGTCFSVFLVFANIVFLSIGPYYPRVSVWLALCSNLGDFYIHLNLSYTFPPLPMYHLCLAFVAKAVLFLLRYKSCPCNTLASSL